MLRSRFLWKLYAGYAAVIMLCAVIVGGLTARWVEQESLREIRDSLKVRAALLRDVARPALAGVPDLALQERVRALGGEVATRFTVITVEGVVIADSEENPSGMDNHAQRPEILAARSHELGIATRFSDTLGTRMMYLALPVRSSGRCVGYVRVSLSLSTIGQRLNRLRAVIAAGAGLAIIAALLLGFFLARRFVMPLTSMISVAESMAGGDYGRRLPIAGQDEIGKLAQALNRMAKSSGNRMETISTERNKLLAILAGMVEGVVAVDRNERVIHMNGAARRILGVPQSASSEQPIWEVTRHREVCEALGHTLRDDCGMTGNLRLVTHAMDQIVELHASPLHDGQREIVGALLVMHDVSELHRLETIRRDFVANASHELKTPITAIRGLVETLLDDPEVTAEKHARFLSRIRSQAIRLSSVVTDLLTLSRLESGDGTQEAGLFDLRDAVIASARVLATTGEERGIKVESHMPEVPLNVRGDEKALCQLVTNLLDNALKYTLRGGRVWIRLAREGGKAVLEVQDTGIGIEPVDRERIFERFYRVDKARSLELGGTGLGLSIVKHIVLSHGGRVSVDSVPGTGSTFRVSLPLASASA